MMGSRPIREPAEFVIWSAASLLGVMLGLAAAFMLWGAFRHSTDQAIVAGAVVALAAGLSLIAVAIDGLPARLFIWAGCATFAVAFFAGGGFFLALAGGGLH